MKDFDTGFRSYRCYIWGVQSTRLCTLKASGFAVVTTDTVSAIVCPKETAYYCSHELHRNATGRTHQHQFDTGRSVSFAKHEAKRRSPHQTMQTTIQTRSLRQESPCCGGFGQQLLPARLRKVKLSGLWACDFGVLRTWFGVSGFGSGGGEAALGA